VECGSPEAGRIIHKAHGRGGPVLAYTRNEAAARLLLPEGFAWRADTYSAGFVYASCRRMGLDGVLPHPHHGKRGQTLLLAMCGAVMQAYAAWCKAEPGSAEGGSDGDG
jgi:hypothetical protein